MQLKCIMPGKCDLSVCGFALFQSISVFGSNATFLKLLLLFHQMPYIYAVMQRRPWQVRALHTSYISSCVLKSSTQIRTISNQRNTSRYSI